jgi:hypothetical protein
MNRLAIKQNLASQTWWHAFYTSTQEAEAGGSWVWCQPRLHSKVLSPKNKTSSPSLTLAALNFLHSLLYLKGKTIIRELALLNLGVHRHPKYIIHNCNLGSPLGPKQILTKSWTQFPLHSHTSLEPISGSDTFEGATSFARNICSFVTFLVKSYFDPFSFLH